MAITNFEVITAPLTTLEEGMVKTVVSLFEKNDEIVTSSYIKNSLYDNFGKVDGPRIRKIINYIRVKKKVKNLLANSRGYYITEDLGKIMKYKQSLKERVSAINAVLESID